MFNDHIFNIEIFTMKEKYFQEKSSWMRLWENIAMFIQRFNLCVQRDEHT